MLSKTKLFVGSAPWRNYQNINARLFATQIDVKIVYMIELRIVDKLQKPLQSYVLIVSRTVEMILGIRFSGNNVRRSVQLPVRLFATKLKVNPLAMSSTQEADYVNAQPYSSIPGPSRFSLLKNSFPGGKYYKLDVNDLLEKFREEYGDISKIPGLFGRPPMILLCDPNYHQTIFRTEGPWPRRFGMEIIEHYRTEVRPELFGGYQGLLNSHGKEWSEFRKTVNPIMIKPKTAKLYIPKIDEVANDFVERIRQIRDPATLQTPENFEEDLNRWALESIGVIAMDTRFGLISNKHDERAMNFIAAVKNFFRLLGELDSKPSLWRIVATPDYKEMIKCLDTLAKFSEEYIEEASKALKAQSTKSSDDHEQSVLEKLLKIDPAIAKVMAMDMIFAGVDTTSSAFTGLLYMLAKNPEKQETLRKEIMTVLPGKKSLFTAEKMARLPYLRACVKEALRMYPVVNAAGRVTSQNLVLNGYQIPKGQFAVMVTTLLQREDKHYPKANMFIPERWLRNETTEESKCPASAKQSHPFTYLPFGFGPRMCIGRRFAEMEIEILISKLVRNFKIKWEHPDLKFRAISLNVPDGKLMFTLTDI